uniref:Uncharacterized protein n=1 Tax=Thaumatella adunca TaxID=2006976 RepID=A0A1Z1MNN7_9FLOR|nr:hypothetical protein [Thaumatella adunca]ARW67374.1 hypothetical protein [Thaumatella adunca]
MHIMILLLLRFASFILIANKILREYKYISYKCV